MPFSPLPIVYRECMSRNLFIWGQNNFIEWCQFGNSRSFLKMPQFISQIFFIWFRITLVWPTVGLTTTRNTWNSCEFPLEFMWIPRVFYSKLEEISRNSCGLSGGSLSYLHQTRGHHSYWWFCYVHASGCQFCHLVEINFKFSLHIAG